MTKLLHPRNSVKYGSLHRDHNLYWADDYHLERLKPKDHRKKKDRRRSRAI